MSQFRVASRELFNNYFRLPSSEIENKPSLGWTLEERFSEVEVVLFANLVSEAASLSYVRYGNFQPNILVSITSNLAPIMINREISSGYWDCPTTEVSNDARLIFKQYFDWNSLSYRDNQYVYVLIEDWPTQQELIGKHALVESQYVQFDLRKMSEIPETHSES